MLAEGSGCRLPQCSHNVPLLPPVPLLTLSNPRARELVKVPLRREALVGQVVTSTVLPAPAYLGSQSSFTWIPSPFPGLLPPRLLYPPTSHQSWPTNPRQKCQTPTRYASKPSRPRDPLTTTRRRSEQSGSQSSEALQAQMHRPAPRRHRRQLQTLAPPLQSLQMRKRPLRPRRHSQRHKPRIHSHSWEWDRESSLSPA
jgi:hypothetical protein